MMFWDSSAVIPLCLREAHTPSMRSLLEKDAVMAAWWGTPIECQSALARLRRDGLLSPDAERKARRVVSRLAAAWTEILPGADLRDGAGRVLLRHPLSAADSLQLAAGLVWADARPSDHPFVCLDRRLREAALREGFRVLPETL
jgi:uncharacterized protein